MPLFLSSHGGWIGRTAFHILTIAFVTACGGDGAPAPVQPEGTPPPVSQRYVGCIGPTANAGTFVLSVAEPRDFTTGEATGEPIPQKSELPEGAPPPIPPVTVTTGTPGGGPTPTTKIVTYTLMGDGGQDLRDLIGHTVEVLGTTSDRTGVGGGSEHSPESLYVTSLRDLASHCK